MYNNTSPCFSKRKPCTFHSNHMIFRHELSSTFGDLYSYTAPAHLHSQNLLQARTFQPSRSKRISKRISPKVYHIHQSRHIVSIQKIRRIRRDQRNITNARITNDMFEKQETSNFDKQQKKRTLTFFLSRHWGSALSLISPGSILHDLVYPAYQIVAPNRRCG